MTRLYSPSRLEQIDAGLDACERELWDQIVCALEEFQP